MYIRICVYVLRSVMKRDLSRSYLGLFATLWSHSFFICFGQVITSESLLAAQVITQNSSFLFIYFVLVYMSWFSLAKFYA